MAALQAEQRTETQWHSQCKFVSKNAHRTHTTAVVMSMLGVVDAKGKEV
jgi:hypothetical protein